MSLKVFQDQLYVTRIFLICFGQDQDIINLDKTEHTQKLRKNGLDKPLKTGWSISKPKGNYHIFKQAPRGSKGCLPFVTLKHMDQIECSFAINFCKLLTTKELGKQLPQERDGKAVPYDDGIQRTIIYNRERLLPWYFDKQKWVPQQAK